MKFIKKMAAPLFLLVLLASGIMQLHASMPVRAATTITEFSLPSAYSSPRGITSGPDGNLWFSESDGANNIGRITPNGVITEFHVPNINDLGQITSGPDGNLWFTIEGYGSLSPSEIGSITPSGVITDYPIPSHESSLGGITTGPDGNIWFTESDVGKIAKISPSGVVTEYSLPYPGPGSLPLGIVTGPDGNLWFTLGSNAVNAIGRITLSGIISEFSIPTANSGPEAITNGPDGNLWFTEGGSGFIGRITPTGVITEYPLPTSTVSLDGITAGHDGNLWFTEYFTGKVGSITTSGVATEYTTPTASSEPEGVTSGPDGNLWFTESNANKIGRVNLKGPQALNYVAMGDSFTSGEGNPPFITGPDYNTNTDRCHRSVKAYPALLGRTVSLHLKLIFVACSGATSKQIISGMNGEPSQLNAINSTTDVVTLTAGGDDIGFADFAQQCVLTVCDSTTSIYHTTLNNITNKLPTLLRTLYQAIKAKIGTKTRVLVVGYPMMLSSSSDLLDCNLLTTPSRRAAEYITAKLNLAIMYAVKAAGRQFTYVSASKPNSPFNGHPLCSNVSYFNEVTLPPNVVYSFHPNALGQQAYAEIVKPYLG